MKEKKRSNLKRAVHNLPDYTSRQLDFHTITERISDSPLTNLLPEFKAPEGLWNKIESRLSNKPVGIRFGSVFLRIAAIVVFLITLSIGYLILKPDALPLANQKRVQDETNLAELYNPSMCTANPSVCNTPVFKELTKQLQDLKQELINMEDLIGNREPQMMKYYYRLINQKVAVEKKMVKIIVES
jgi:hypothetical protein